MLSNLAASLIKNGRVKTTDAKAKEVRPFVERMVTFAKRGDLHARRIVLTRLKDPLAVKKLFDEIGPQFTDRFGGYTRILKLGFRQGDNSPVSLIEFVGSEIVKASSKTKTSKKKARSKQKEAAEKATIQATDAVEAEDAEEVTADTAEGVEADETDEETGDTSSDEESDQSEDEEKNG
jgi:large subunit ribosomal protein L17